MMQYEIVVIKERQLLGVQARTHNADPAMPQIIGGLWQRWLGGGRPAALADAACYGVYSAYAAQEQGEYTVTVGSEGVVAGLPEGTSRLLIPAGRYAKFSVSGDMPAAIAAFWRQLPVLGLKRAFTVDFEQYAPGTTIPKSVDIYIALQENDA